jgi:hypothetical protein
VRPKFIWQRKKGPSAGGLEALRPWVVPVCSKHNGVTLARSLFTKRAIFWINPLGLQYHPFHSSAGSA